MALAAAIPLEQRAPCVYTCGSVCYWQSDINEALDEAFSLFQSGDTMGTSLHSRIYMMALLT